MEFVNEKELISIIVPVFNARKYIRQTIESVRRQTIDNWELLLVDDHSDDGTAEYVKKYIKSIGESRIRLIEQPANLGAAAARNTGVREAKGRYLAYLDADDLWAKRKLEKELAFMKEKHVAFVFTGYEFANEKGKGLGKVVKVPATLNYNQALKNTTIFTSTVMFDTALIGKELLQMPNVKSEDTALWWKILKNGYTAYGLNENLVRYRRIGGTLSSNKLHAISRIWNLYRKREHLSIPCSLYHMIFWGTRAVLRRL